MIDWPAVTLIPVPLDTVPVAAPPNVPAEVLYCTCPAVPPGVPLPVIPREDVEIRFHLLPVQYNRSPYAEPNIWPNLAVGEVVVLSTIPPKGPVVCWFWFGTIWASAYHAKPNSMARTKNAR